MVTDEGLLKPCVGGLSEGGIYIGGNADQVEKHLGLPGEEILYVGDHVFSDIHISKSVHRWRTALIIRELESELTALEAFESDQRQLSELMAEKERLEDLIAEREMEVKKEE